MVSIVKLIKKVLPLRWKSIILSRIHPDKKWLRYADDERKKIFVFISGFYQNLGDMAITYAQFNFLQALFPEALVICVPSEETFTAIYMIKRYIKRDDLVTLIGGGNMSDMYFHLEISRREVVKNFPNNHIVSFPQTAFFSNSLRGRKELYISRYIYSRHSNLQLFAREPESYARMRLYFPTCNISLAPDIVLSLDKVKPSKQRKSLLICLRDDKESAFTTDFRDRLCRGITASFSNVSIMDTTDVTLEDCLIDKYMNTLESFWIKIKSSKAVVTDRLHCMIFCAITGTPCVALDNANHKVSGVYDAWLKDYETIRIVNTTNIKFIISIIQEIENYTAHLIDKKKWDDSFKSLSEACTR